MNYERLCLMLPTYGRSKDRLPRFIRSAYDNAESAICFCFCVNERDEDTQRYLRETAWPDDFEYDVIVEDSQQPDLAAYFNLMYERTRFNDDATLVSMLGDDMVFETAAYDQAILARANETEGRGVYWCDDAYIARDKLCVNLFVTRQLVRATRLPFMCPWYKADMIDVVWYETGRAAGLLQYIPEVVIRHEHSTALQKRSYDQTFRRLVPLQQAANDPARQRAGVAYARIAAGNLISAGYGSWQD